MSLVAAVKLVNLFELFSSPKLLYSSENAHRHLAFLLEVFNNVIQYQYNGNQHLVYAIVRRKDSFGHLSSLTLKKAIVACDKIYDDKASRQYESGMDEKKKVFQSRKLTIAVILCKAKVELLSKMTHLTDLTEILPLGAVRMLEIDSDQMKSGYWK